MITQVELKKILYYHPESGDFVWLVTEGRATAGTQAGTLNNGYIRIKVGKKKHRASRLAWLYMTGRHPKEQIDHRDMVRHNNAWGNLREADGVQQNANKRTQRNNTTGYRGVARFRNKYRAYIYVGKKQKLLCYCSTAEEAALRARDAQVTQFGDYARLQP